VTSLSFSEDLPPWAQLTILMVVLLSIALLFFEQRSRGGSWLLSGISLLAVILLALAVLRPAWVSVSGRSEPAPVAVLIDASHRMALPGDDRKQSRRDVAEHALDGLRRAWPSARVTSHFFADGQLQTAGGKSEARQDSDLALALQQVLAKPGEAPRAIVVLSDGRLSAPTSMTEKAIFAELGGRTQGVPVHTVAVAKREPKDRSIRAVRTTGSAIAHQPFTLHVEVGCSVGVDCDAVEIEVRELMDGGPAQKLAQGLARMTEGRSELDLDITLDRTGGRVIEVRLEEALAGDEVPHNDARLLTVEVRRDRTRILHVAGRPTYDVRALRTFLKSDASIDLVSFFILRTEQDDTRASQDDLSLIPFPVDELFTSHLPSFDAVVLQDIDARTYGLLQHFPALRRYVLSGGGLILVGGPSAFSAGGYANTPIEDVLPVQLPVSGELTDNASVTPGYTRVGRAAPMLRGIRALLGDALPPMPGYNRMGLPKESALVLWEHPDQGPADASADERMPLLSLGEVGDGRTIALAVDGTHALGFGRFGTETAGDGHRVLWEGLLGWLMRDPRFESAQVRLGAPCIVGYPATLLVSRLPGLDDPVELEIASLGVEGATRRVESSGAGSEAGLLAFRLPELGPGGYAARVKVGGAPPTRHVFACEIGGEAHSDSRPDAARLETVAAALRGRFVDAADIGQLPAPERTFVLEQRSLRPVGPPYLWSLSASVMLALSWILRRARGLA
jgi:uncharacterized membrane protein